MFFSFFSNPHQCVSAESITNKSTRTCFQEKMWCTPKRRGHIQTVKGVVSPCTPYSTNTKKQPVRVHKQKMESRLMSATGKKGTPGHVGSFLALSLAVLQFYN
eukprot:GHVU01153700.1.p1 GENE.GHVU01153700.1~~GHVU01153700.1.p1  ORF type:complete len:103 (-),score=1.71 GHVU01153700.1:602-910(-)